MKYTLFRGIIIASLLVLAVPSHAATTSPNVKLAVPIYLQQHTLSCEVSSLHMALNYHRASVTEDQLIAQLAFDPTKRSGNIWGDPDTGFVGKINGSMGGTGYGVYWEPIAQLAQRYRRAEIITHGTTADLVENLDHKRPIIVWGYYGTPKPMTWQTPAGKIVNAINGEHARIVVGYKGSSANPEGFYINDPLSGQQYWTTDSFLKNWASFDNSGVVVYQNPRWAKVPGIAAVWEISPDNSSRHALAMSWESFLSRGWSPDAIVSVTPDFLSKFPIGDDIQ